MWSKRILPKAKSIGASCGAPAIVAALLLFGAPAPTRAANPYSLTSVLRKSGPVRSGLIRIPGLKASTPYSLLLSIRTPRVFGSDSRVIVDLKQGGAELLHKTLHLGDPDFYALFHVPKNGRAELSLEVTNLDGPATYLLQVNRWPRNRSLEEEPNDRWEDANPIALGHTVFGTADDVPYIPVPGTNAGAALEGNTGVDWFRFEFTEARPKLVLFQVDLMERDNIPVDVAVFRVQRGGRCRTTRGRTRWRCRTKCRRCPETNSLTRILRGSGTYYIRVRANHPEYKLRTRVYDPPPYRDPRQAVQTAVDYIMGAGDSWHANTPRRGGVLDRVANVHQETSLCVACHPTHFSQRAQLYAVPQRLCRASAAALQFLAERFYNNPRPFYGFEKEGAVWARMISAPANVLGRMSRAARPVRAQVSGERRDRVSPAACAVPEALLQRPHKLPPAKPTATRRW